jgi:hypothetical protein
MSLNYNSKIIRWGKTLGEKTLWYGITYAAGFGAIPLTDFLVDGKNDLLVCVSSIIIYTAMIVTLALVGERIIRKQTDVGHSASVGAMIGYERARKKSKNKNKLIRIARIGYIVEQIIEEIPILIPAIALATNSGLKPALVFLAGGAVPTIAVRLVQFNSLYKYRRKNAA